MAADYNGTSDVSKSSTSPVSAVAFTLAGWVYSDTTTGARYAFGLQAPSTAQGWRIGFNGTALILQCTGAGTQSTQSAGNAASGQWMHLGIVASSATSRALYKNGSSLATGTNSLTPASVSQIRIGAGSDASGNAASYWDGAISHVCLWNVALTAQEMLSLYNGAHPRDIRRASIKAHYALGGFDTLNGNDNWGNAYGLDAVPAARSIDPRIFHVGWSGITTKNPVANSYTLTCTSRSATGTSNSATLTAARSLVDTTRTATGTVQNATLTVTRRLTCSVNGATGTSNVATLTAARLLTCSTQAAAGTSNSATLQNTRLLTATTQTATGTVQDAVLAKASRIVATSQTATGTSNAATLVKGYSLACSVRTGTGTSNTATLTKASLLSAIVQTAIGTANNATLSTDQPERASYIDHETLASAEFRASGGRARSRASVGYAAERVTIARARSRTAFAKAVERVDT